MKNLGKALLLGAALTAVLFISGCGEEKKYEETRGQLDATIEKIETTKDETFKVGYDAVNNARNLSDSELKSRRDAVNKAIADLDKLYSEGDAQVKTLQEIASKETKFSGDALKNAQKLKYVKKYKDTFEVYTWAYNQELKKRGLE